MRAVILSLVAAAALATPAMANEARVEARGGIFWVPSINYEKAVVGVAAGYDWDMGDSAFVGVEASADKVLANGFDVVGGLGARVGAKLGNGKLYATGGYTVAEGPNSIHAGAGYQHNLGGNLYGKVEYRHFFTEDNFPNYNAAVVGIGMKF